METDTIRWFQHVADGITVTEVASLYRVTQPGVSRALARLESEVGAPLLRRSGRTLRLTHAGAVFKRYADAALHALDDGLAAVEQLIDPESGTVVVAAQPSLSAWLAPELIRGFGARHPGVRFALHHADDGRSASRAPGSDRVPRGDRPELELTTHRPADRSRLWHRLLAEPLCLAVAADHPPLRPGGRALSLKDVAQEPFVVLRTPSPLRDQGMELCARAGFQPRIGLECADLQTVSAMVAAGLGVAVLPLYWARSTGAAGEPEGDASGVGGGDAPSLPSPSPRLFALTDPTAFREILITWPAERRLLPASELFRRFVLARAAAGELGPRPVTRAPFHAEWSGLEGGDDR